LVDLQLLGATNDPAPLRWESWATPALDHAHAGDAHLALFRRDAGGARLEWSTVRPDGYQPTLYVATNWAYSGRPVLLFSYRMGAAAEELELWGLDLQDRPTLLDRVEAATFDYRSWRGLTIEAVGHPEPPLCWTFETGNAKLVASACPP
jgi:hypothetical protein